MLAQPRPDILDERYEIGTLIGRGGMGDVHRAIDHRLGREVAVKFLRPDLAVQPDVRSRFEEEARSAARLSHPNVVMVLDSGEYEKCPYLVMERLPGHNLYDELVRGPLSPERVRSIAQDMLSALGAAHEIGIVHRDVKPANILLTDDGRAKLADFGIAKSTEGLDHTQVGQVLGTPAYLAPERLAGEPATPGADLYALGVVLYEALLGEQPFRGETPVAVAHAIANTDPPPLSERCPGLDPGLRAAIDGAMVKDAGRRFQTAAEMDRYLNGEASEPTVVFAAAETELEMRGTEEPLGAAATAPPPAAAVLAPASRWWRTRPRELRLLVVAAAVLSAALLAVAVMNDDPPADPATTPPAPTGSAPAPTGSAPAPLVEAIDGLEKAVKG